MTQKEKVLYSSFAINSGPIVRLCKALREHEENKKNREEIRQPQEILTEYLAKAPLFNLPPVGYNRELNAYFVTGAAEEGGPQETVYLYGNDLREFFSLVHGRLYQKLRSEGMGYKDPDIFG